MNAEPGRPIAGRGAQLPGRARVVVVGGGIAGVSALFHLTQNGWRDVVLVEKGELTCGSTWHAAGLCTQFHASRPIAKLLMRSMEIYDELRGADGGDIGLTRVGSVRLATTEERLDEFRVRQGMARTLDLPFELIGPSDVRQLFPLANVDDVLAAAHLPTDGYVDPTMATQAMAHHARQAGADIVQHTAVTGLERTPTGWHVQTSRGAIECEQVLLAAGQWTRQVAALAGADLPIVPLQHHYVITEGIDAVRELAGTVPVLRDPEASFYVRREGEGLLIGPFESDALPWAVDHVPEDFEGKLLPGQLDHILPVLQAAASRVPVLEDAGLKHIINGPDGYTPDGHCLMGELPGLPGMHVLAGFSIFGIVFGAGAGAYAAEWLIDGQPSDALWELDVRRFGAWASARPVRVARAREVYAREYAVHLPEEELPAGRPLKTDPLYDRLAARGAVFGQRFGWERALWFAPEGVAQVDDATFRIPAWHEHVGRECRTVREAVGVLDQTSFAKFEVSGPEAEDALARLCANRLPTEVGRISLTQMLNDTGGVECDVTVTRIEPDRFYIVSAAATEEHDLAHIRRHMLDRPDVRIDNVTASVGVLTLAGPRSRELLSRICHEDVSREAFPFFRCRELTIGPVRCRVLRLSYVGELGFELHHPAEYSRALYETVLAAGDELGLIDFGYRALDSMRLEKGYRLWGADVLADVTPLEAGFERLVDFEHQFVGRDALIRQRETGPERQLVTLALDRSEPMYPHVYERVLHDGQTVGHVMAGGFGHVVEAPLALAYLPPSLARDGQAVQVECLGEPVDGSVHVGSVFDPEHQRLRA